MMDLPWLATPWKRFLDRVAQDRLGHALLISGAEGVGKRRLADGMAAHRLCLAPGETACGTCRSCQLMRSGAHPELFRVEPRDGKRIISVDQIRELGSSLALSTTISPRKLVVIAPAEAMNVNAANALLKSLEEPQGETVILLVSHDVSRLPVTIRSRCQALVVSPPSPVLAREWLMSDGEVAAELADAALEASGFRPLLARQLIEDDTVAGFSRVRNALQRLVGRPGAASAAANALGETDPVLLWSWLSQLSAATLRSCHEPSAATWLPPGFECDVMRLSALQHDADRNRRLVGTGTRQDLLLHEWLLEWAAHAGTTGDRGRAAPQE